jgi:hypothetical protein
MHVQFRMCEKLKHCYSLNNRGRPTPFYGSTSFGNVFGISVIHSMEVNRYSTVLLIAALFAQLWAIRWLIEIGLMKRRVLWRGSKPFYVASGSVKMNA